MAAGVEFDVTAWLTALGLDGYAAAFRDNHIDGETLPALTMDDLKEIGVVSVGHRRRILGAIAELAKREPTAPPPTPARAEQAPGERRQVTVLFADIAGYTKLSSELDAEQVHELLSKFFERVDGVITDCGGRIDKHIGDCAMAVFGVPTAHDDDVKRAVTAALAIHAAMAQVSQAVSRTIAAHVGIASGEVVASRTGSAHYTEFTVTGETVNLASRLTGLAHDGETAVSSDIVVSLGDEIDAASGGEVPVKGFAAPVGIWRVRGLRPAGEHRPPLVGRRTEMAQCEAALTAVLAGETGAIVYVRGEPGIGKSSIADETVRRAEERGFVSARATVFDFGTGLERDPLRALAAALLGADAGTGLADAVVGFAAARGLDEAEITALKDLTRMDLGVEERSLLDAMSAAARRTARGEALGALAVAAARSAPSLVVVEDVHWADAIVLEGLVAMGRLACAGSRTVLLLTSRIEKDPFATLQASWSELSPVIIELGRLSDRDARELADRLLGGNPLLAQCIERAGGNPLFLEQLIRHASTGGTRGAIPGSIRSVVAAQIDRLAAADKMALQAAAVLGQQFSVEALRRLLGHDTWTPESLIASRLVLAGKDTLQFAHGLLREGIYASVLKAERRRLHLAAAAWFEGRDRALRAEQLAQAGAPEAVPAYLSAVDEQVGRYRVDEALDLLSRADFVAESASDRFAVSLCRGALLTEAGRPMEALAAEEQALAAAPNEESRARAKLGTAAALRLVDRNAEALALLDEAAPVFSATDRIADLARLEHLRGNLLFPLGRAEECEAAHQRAFDLAQRSGSVELEALALGGLGDAAFATGRYVTSHRRTAECVEIARKHGFGRIEVANAPGLAVFSGDLAGALTAIEEAVEMAGAAAQPRAELTSRHCAMSLYLWAARPQGVEPHYHRAQALTEKIGARRFRGFNLTLMGEAIRQLGDASRALAMQEEALAIARDGGMSYFGPIVFGFRAAAAGDDDDLRRESIREGELVLAQGGVALAASFFYGWAIETSLRAEQWPEARRLADAFAARFAIERVPDIEFQVERGRLLADLGERGPTPALLGALERCRDIGRRLGYGVFPIRIDPAWRMEAR